MDKKFAWKRLIFQKSCSAKQINRPWRNGEQKPKRVVSSRAFQVQQVFSKALH